MREKRKKESVKRIRDKIASSTLDQDTKISVDDLIVDLDERLCTVEDELNDIHQRLAFGQIPFALQEKILRSVAETPENLSILWTNGIGDLRNLGKMFGNPEKYKSRMGLTSAWNTMEKNWLHIMCIISKLSLSHPLAKGMNGSYLDLLIKKVKQDRDILSHSGFRKVPANELKRASEGLELKDEFRFLLALNEALSLERKESIYENRI